MSGLSETVVIGAGVTGVAIGARSGACVLEQADGPGGICRSYYMIPRTSHTLDRAPDDDGAYRFEVGGGHWIFGGDPGTLAELELECEFRVYERDAVVRLGSLGLTVPYPLQAHVDALGPAAARTVRRELDETTASPRSASTLGEWLRGSFGPTLGDVFFRPFHDRYTAGLTDLVAPQDSYKSPSSGNRGYNTSFRYPVGGLDRLAQALASRCTIRYGQQITGIDAQHRTIALADGTEFPYRQLLSTLPLDRAVAMAGVHVNEPPDPYTSVLVINVGGVRGDACPSCHWQYEPDSRSGFHRIGFYSNVDADFLPSDRRDGSHVSMYVERAFPGGRAPTDAEIAAYTDAVIDELTERGYLTTVEVVHPSWVDVAYTWRSPGSSWRQSALDALADVGITQIGRYGRWHFQGIAESIQEGFTAGAAVVR